MSSIIRRRRGLIAAIGFSCLRGWACTTQILSDGGPSALPAQRFSSIPRESQPLSGLVLIHRRPQPHGAARADAPSIEDRSPQSLALRPAPPDPRPGHSWIFFVGCVPPATHAPKIGRRVQLYSPRGVLGWG